MASKSIQLRFRIDQDQILHRGPDAQPGRRQGAQEIYDIPNIQVPIPRHEPPHQPLDTSVEQDDVAGDGVEALAALKGVFLDVEGEVEEGGKGVGELEDAKGGDDAGEAGEVGDRGPDDKGDGPVDGDDGHPDPFARLVGERGRAKYFDAYIVVEDCGGGC